MTVHQCWDMKGVILGHGREVKADVKGFGESLAHWILELQAERAAQREKIEQLTRECDGLKLAIGRSALAYVDDLDTVPGSSERVDQADVVVGMNGKIAKDRFGLFKPGACLRWAGVGFVEVIP